MEQLRDKTENYEGYMDKITEVDLKSRMRENCTSGSVRGRHGNVTSLLDQSVNHLLYGKPKTFESNKKKSISWRWIALSSLMLSLLPMLSGCASYSLRSNPVVVQTSNVAITESSDASGFYLKLTAWREKVKVYLENETQD